MMQVTNFISIHVLYWEQFKDALHLQPQPGLYPSTNLCLLVWTQKMQKFVYENADQLLLVLHILYIAMYTQASGNTHIPKICYIKPLTHKLFTHLQKALLSPQCLYPLYLGSFKVRQLRTFQHIQTIFLAEQDQQNCTAFQNNNNSFRNPSTSKIWGPDYTQG